MALNLPYHQSSPPTFTERRPPPADALSSAFSSV